MIILSERSWTFAQLSPLARQMALLGENIKSWWWAFIWCYWLRFSGKTFYYTSAILPIWKEGVIFIQKHSLELAFLSDDSYQKLRQMCRNETLLSQHLIKISFLGLGISTLDTSFHILSVSQWKKEVDGNMEHEKLYQVSDGFVRDTWMIGGIWCHSHKYFGSLAASRTLEGL